LFAWLFCLRAAEKAAMKHEALKWPFLRSALTFFSYLYLLRFSVLTGIVILVLPLLAIGGGEKMLAGAFDQWEGRQIIALTLIDVVMFWTLLVTGRLVLDYAEGRGSAPALMHKALWRRVWLTFCVVVVIPIIVIAYVYSGDDIKPRPFLIFGLLGVAIAIVVLLLTHILRRIIVPPGHAKFDDIVPFLLPKNLTTKANDYRGFAAAGSRTLKRLRQLPTYVTRGYLDESRDPPRLLPGHGLALALSVGFAVVYVLLGVLHWGTAIVYVLVLLTVLCWILSGLAFFLDSFRIPVLTFLGLWLFLAAQSPKSDHYFNVSKPPASYSGAKSAEYILAERPGAQDCPIIVVSANGGGIQSAAWTAKVLSGLAGQFEKQGERNLDKFLRSIRLISGVSGGSVGTMFFVNAIQPPGSTTRPSFAEVVREAEESGLSEVVWGMAYPDLLHAFFPWLRRDLLLDRGHALEETWVKAAARSHPSSSLAGSLLEWNRGVEEGWRPATIFNSTFAESGERLQISTTPAGVVINGKLPVGRKEFFYLYNTDIRVATAARLSATYPYVSPATRPFYAAGSPVFKDQPSDYAHVHAVDGGYFDNSGLCALTEWLNEALEERADAKRQAPGKQEILVLEIRGFPEGTNAPYKVNRGWFYQLYAPLSTLLGVWTTGQAATNVTEFDLLQKYWAGKEIVLTPIVFQPAQSVYSKARAAGKKGVLPLSWHLRKDDKDLIEEAWNYECANNDNCKRVLEFVGRP
jgi:hypothetical protein